MHESTLTEYPIHEYTLTEYHIHEPTIPESLDYMKLSLYESISTELFPLVFTPAGACQLSVWLEWSVVCTLTPLKQRAIALRCRCASYLKGIFTIIFFKLKLSDYKFLFYSPGY
jgi:hypothetical protein